MKRSLSLIGMVLLSLPVVTLAPSARPQISALHFVRIKTTAPDKANQFYGDFLQLPRLHSGCSTPDGKCFFISPSQRVELVSSADSRGASMIDVVAFWTSDARALRQYLVANGLKPQKLLSSQGQQRFEILDAEQHRLVFASNKGGMMSYDMAGQRPTSQRMIHTGFVVHDRAAEDHFYKDILGFRLYWHGGMKDDEDRWVAMQVPDGTDWIEYMLNIAPNADHHTLGVMNHISLGVEDIHATEKQLIANGWKPGEAPKIGRDGKWQLNLYDPDDTRVEFMEFKPAQEPCCNPFTGPHPGSQK